MPTIPFKGFAPSVDPTTPGAVLDCQNMLPTLRGMRSAPGMVPVSTDPFPEPVTGGATAELLSGAFRTIVGTADKLFEITGATRTDVSGEAYTGGQNRWRFTQFGNATIATNGADKMQESIVAGDFSSIDSAPVASIVEVTTGFVFGFDTTDDISGHQSNGWACCAIFNQDDWVPSQATQAANGVIVDAPGGITAGHALGTNIVAYKRSSMHYGTYQGPPVIWGFLMISNQVGTPTHEAVVSIGTAHYFLGSDAQVYQYDGSAVTPIGDAVKDWLYTNWSKQFQTRIESRHDQENSLIFWYFCSTKATTATPDTCLVLNYRTGQFGRADAKIDAALTFISGQITWDGLGDLPGVTTWDTLPSVPYNSSFWASETELPAIVDSNHVLQSLSGNSGASSLTSGFVGDDQSYSYYSGIVPRFSQVPESCTGSAQSLTQLGATPTPQALADMYDGVLAADFAARYAQVTLNFTGNHEILGAVPLIQDAGSL